MLYLCRHGETQWTIEGKHTSYTDLHLTANGKIEALALHQKLAKGRFDQIISSPRIRALETAEPLKPTIEPLAVEWDYGDFEGLTSLEIHQKYPHWNIFTDGAPNGESPSQVSNRADLLLKKLLNNQGNVLLFSHGHFLKVLAARFLQLEIGLGRLFSLKTASLSILKYESSKPVILTWNC